MIDGTLTFTVNNGREPITAVFKPEDVFSFCDGQWHEVHGKDNNTKAMMKGQSILDPAMNWINLRCILASKSIFGQSS